MEDVKKLLKEEFGEDVEFEEFRGELTVIVKEDSLFECLKFLRESPFLFFDFLTDITAVDYYPEIPRFAIVYHLYSFKFSRRIRVKTFLEKEEVSSCVSIWKSAEWPEREIYDLFGIYFTLHPNLKRILLWEKFPGHPLRKDYPMDVEIPNPDLHEVEEE